ncbi:MAG: hypothetical protein ABSA86_05285 [Oryzomonas sp.]
MKTIKLAVPMLALAIGSSTYAVETGGQVVTFAVGCFDVGASVLQGRPGVISVQKARSDGREVDLVVFDPRKVSVPTMEEWLKDAGTYVGTEHNPGREH